MLHTRLNSATIAALTYVAVLALALLWIGGAILPPVLQSQQAQNFPGRASDGSTSQTFISFVYYAYSRVCHQMGERSFQIAGQQLAVCARCSGIYAGYFIGLLIYPFARSLTRLDTPPRIWLIVALAPIAIDVAGNYFGAFENTLFSRSLTGLIAGTACAFYTLPGLVGLASAWLQARDTAALKA